MTRRVLVVSLSAVALLIVGRGVISAHHSVAATYLVGKTVRIEGTLKEFLWRNPHSFMRVEAPDDKGQMFIWVIEGAAPQVLTEAGLSQSTLRPGDRVIVTGMPGRIAEDHRMLLHTIERPSDGFKWVGPAANVQQ
ncbi:MAG: hypothetical protein HYU37_03355 [Acidobacteria bacterium]|nr:hypothetical protein [Acidobacteriota bacterium]